MTHRLQQYNHKWNINQYTAVIYILIHSDRRDTSLDWSDKLQFTTLCKYGKRILPVVVDQVTHTIKYEVSSSYLCSEKL